MSRTLLRIVPLLFLAVLLAACSDTVKPNRDAELASKAVDTAKRMIADYDRRDFDAVRGYVAPEFRTLRIDEGFDGARHEVTVLWVNLTNDSIRLILGWEATWTVQSREASSGGQCTLIFDQNTGRLVGLEGDHPFGVPVPKTVPDTPGL